MGRKHQRSRNNENQFWGQYQRKPGWFPQLHDPCTQEDTNQEDSNCREMAKYLWQVSGSGCDCSEHKVAGRVSGESSSLARTKPAASPYPPTKLSAKYSHGSIERPLVCAVPFISTVHDLSGISHRLSQSIAGTVTAKASVENKSIDALSDCEDLYRAAKSTTTVASGKLQQTNVSRAKGLTTCRR